MDVYETTKMSNGAGAFSVVVQIVWIVVALWLLRFGVLPQTTADKGLLNAPTIAILAFDLMTFVRFFPTLFVFVRRKSSIEELVAAPIAFGIYYVGFLFLLSVCRAHTS
jgi:hypothetical protein